MWVQSLCQGRSLGGGHGDPLQYSCLESPMDRVAWQAIVHGVAKSWTRPKQLSMRARSCIAGGFFTPSYQGSLYYCVVLLYF